MVLLTEWGMGRVGYICACIPAGIIEFRGPAAQPVPGVISSPSICSSGQGNQESDYMCDLPIKKLPNCPVPLTAALQGATVCCPLSVGMDMLPGMLTPGSS